MQAQYKDSANSMKALAARQEALEGQLKALGQKHTEQAAMADKAREAQREYAEQVERLRRELEGLGSSSSATAECQTANYGKRKQRNKK